jgi:hypothetical protein
MKAQKTKNPKTKTSKALSIAAVALSCLAFAPEVVMAEGAPSGPGLGQQTLGGLAWGTGGMLVGGTVGAGLLSAYCFTFSEDCGFAGLGGAFVGGILGFAGGFPYGVYRFGQDENHQTSLAWTYAGTVAGAALGFGTTAAITQLDDEDAWFAAACFGLLGAPLGALVGFNATREPIKGIPQVSFAPLLHGGAVGQLTWRF